MYICAKCGSGNPDGSRFCRRCGEEIPPIDTWMQQQKQPQTVPGRRPAGSQAANAAGKQRGKTGKAGKKKRSRKQESGAGLSVVMGLLGALLAMLVIAAVIVVGVHYAGLPA